MIPKLLFAYVQDICAGPERHEHCGDANAIARRRAQICDQALRKLANFEAFEIAEKALIAEIEALERLSDRNGEQVQTLQMLKQALTDLREGIPATNGWWWNGARCARASLVDERCHAFRRIIWVWSASALALGRARRSATHSHDLRIGPDGFYGCNLPTSTDPHIEAKTCHVVFAHGALVHGTPTAGSTQQRGLTACATWIAKREIGKIKSCNPARRGNAP